MAQATVKVFMSGHSQAIRLPKPFHVSADEMYITKELDKIILSPKHKTTWTDFFSTSPCPDFVIDRDMSLPAEKDMF